ncbi:MAG: PHB depolymerase family esterase [Patescibacteria group bacterium]
MQKLMWAVVALMMVVAIVGSIFLLKVPDSGTGRIGGTGENPIPANGKQTYRLEVDGVMREFIVYRPTNVAVEQTLPLVVMFHGSNGSGSLMFRESGWVKMADAEGIMVAFPTGLKYHVFADDKVKHGQVVQNVAEHKTQWNTEDFAQKLDPAYPDQVLQDDVAFTRALVSFVKDNYATDTSRVYASGFSNGGAFAGELAVNAPDLFAAIALTSSGHLSDETVASRQAGEIDNFVPRPVMIMLGADDQKLTHGAGVDAFATDESAVQDGGVLKERMVRGWLGFEGLADEYTFDTAYNTAHFTYSTSLLGATNEFQFFIVPRMQHQYPNGNNFRFAVVDIFWPFFEQHSL